MILYKLTDGDVWSGRLPVRPRTCFLMTQLGKPLSPGLQATRRRVTTQLRKKDFDVIDANSMIIGKDFLDKIWRNIISVPIGVAIIDKTMSTKTIANIFYELGMMDVLGKFTIVIKSQDFSIPSDFIRTEYIVDEGRDFGRKFRSFLDAVLEQEKHFTRIAEDTENNPLLAIDYLRRAYLISGNVRHRRKANLLLKGAGLEGRAKDSVEMLWAEF